MSQSLALTNAEILPAIATVIGVSRNPAAWDATTESDVRQIIRTGLRRFFNPATPEYHHWRFLERLFTQTGSPAYSAGTITVAGGTVTIAGSTWPPYAADSLIRVGGRTLYVTSVVNTTTLLVDNDGVAAAAGTEYELYRWRYPLPSDFAEFIGNVVVDKGDGCGRPVRIGIEQDVKLRYASQFQVGNPNVCAVFPGNPDTDADNWYLAFWPVVDEDATISAIYRTSPLDKLDSADLTLQGSVVQIDPVHADTVLSAILSAAEEFYTDKPGVHSARFAERLAGSIAIDRRSQGPVTGVLPRGVDPREYSLFYHNPDYSGAIL